MEKGLNFLHSLRFSSLEEENVATGEVSGAEPERKGRGRLSPVLAIGQADAPGDTLSHPEPPANRGKIGQLQLPRSRGRHQRHRERPGRVCNS